jgi:prepilin-type N-terminal cleavage/methylation domain-containing protein
MRIAEWKARASQGGFTLIETVITLVVLSIAAVGVLSVFTMGMRGSANPVVIDQAIQLAQEKMDTILGDRMNSNAGYGFAHIILGNYGAETPVTGFVGFNRSVNIYCVTAADLIGINGLPGAGGCASGYTHVTVTVANAAIGSVNLDTVVTNY